MLARVSTSMIDVRYDAAPPRLHVALRGPVSGDQMVQTLSQLYLDQPEVTREDMLFDMREYQGSAEAVHIRQIAAAYLQSNRDPCRPCRTAFVTPDPNFRLWAASMSMLFAGREHRAFESWAEAEAFLDEPMRQRPAFVASAALAKV